MNARREQHHLRLIAAAGREAAENLTKLSRIVIDGQHLAGLERVREDARHHQAVLQHVGNAAGGAHIVFQHHELAGLGVAHQVDAGDVGMDAARNFKPNHLAPEMLAGIDQLARNLAVLENALLAVDVLQEKVQRHHALRQPALDAVPFRTRQDAGNQVEGEQSLGASAVAIDGEGDPLHQEGQIGQLAAFLELRRSHGGQLLEHLGTAGARLAGSAEHLVVIRPWVVALEKSSTKHLLGSRRHSDVL